MTTSIEDTTPITPGCTDRKPSSGMVTGRDHDTTIRVPSARNHVTTRTSTRARPTTHILGPPAIPRVITYFYITPGGSSGTTTNTPPSPPAVVVRIIST